jgi:hypothetical protein
MSRTAYDKDLAAGSREQAGLLRAGAFAGLDLHHLAEEIEDLGQARTPSSRAKRGDPTGSWESKPRDRHASLAMTTIWFKRDFWPAG